MLKTQYSTNYLKKEVVSSKIAKHIEQVKKLPQFKRYRRSDVNSESESQFRKIDVPPDGSCLFWAVTMAYLIPVRNNDALFRQRYKALFGDKETATRNLDHIRDWVRNLGAANCDDTFPDLVRNVFRNRVVDHIRNHSDYFRVFFISEGERSFNDHLKYMRKPNTWGDEPEIRAMSEMLGADISVFGESNTRYNNGDIQIRLFHVGAPSARNHYNFGLEQHVVNDIEVGRLQNSLKEFTGHHSLSNNRQLVRNGDDSSDYDSIDNQARLNEDMMNAIRGNDLEETKLKEIEDFLSNGADINFKDANRGNNTPLHAAVRKGETRIVQLLISRGADINIRNDHGSSPLDIAKLPGTPSGQESVKILERSLSGSSVQQVSVEHQPMEIDSPKKTSKRPADGQPENGDVKRLKSSESDKNVPELIPEYLLGKPRDGDDNRDLLQSSYTPCQSVQRTPLQD